jgi:hypothetical protein
LSKSLNQEEGGTSDGSTLLRRFREVSEIRCSESDPGNRRPKASNERIIAFLHSHQTFAIKVIGQLNRSLNRSMFVAHNHLVGVADAYFSILWL